MKQIGVKFAVDHGYLSCRWCLVVGLRLVEEVLSVVDGGDKDYCTFF